MTQSGVYSVSYRAGHEHFTLARGAAGTAYEARIEQRGDEGSESLHLRAEFDADIRFRELELTRSNGLRARADHDGARLRCVLSGAGGDREVVHAFDPRVTEIDWRTPFFNGLTCLRLGLLSGQSRTIDVRFFDPETFEPKVVEQLYECIGNESATTPAGTFACVRYQYSAGSFSAPFWMREDGLVVRYGEIWELLELS